MMNSTYKSCDPCQSDDVAVGIEMDMEVKSEPDSDYKFCDSVASVTSSVEEVPIGSDDDFEELEEEPLVEIDSITVPQQLVEVELEPSLLLFVNSDSKKCTANKNVPVSKCDSINTEVLTKEKSTSKVEEEIANRRKSITKALRNVKRKHNILRQNPTELCTNNAPEVSEDRNIESGDNIQNSSDVSTSPCDSSSELGFERVNPFLSLTPNRKNKHKVGHKHVKLKKKLNNLLTYRKPVKGKSKMIKEKKLWKESYSQSSIDDSFLPSRTKENEKEALYVDKLHEGKENTQNNNEELKAKEDCILNTENDHSNNLNKTKKINKNKRGKGNSLEEDKNIVKMVKPESFDCTVCGKKFREKSHLATHSRAHIDIRNYKCSECGNLFKTKTNLFFHMKTHEEAPFICEKCNKTYPERKILMRHIRVVHSGEGNYNCDQCGRSFKSAQNLDLHFTLHTGNKPFSCNVCAKSFVYKSTYTAHMKAHEADDSFNCDLCPSNVVDRGELRRHCNHHSEARPWLCTVCGKGYPLKGTLKNHMKTHEPEKPFRCNECGKSFMKKQSYECHLKIHAGENPQYMCDQCSQSYFNVFALKRHYMKHTSERRFVCDICNKAFWMKDALKVHKRSHANIKMFHCTQCSKAFVHKHTLVAHLRTHSSDQPYSCSVCPKTFIHKYNLDRHERQHSMPPIPAPPTALPLPPSLIMMAPPKHLDLPTLHIL